MKKYLLLILFISSCTVTREHNYTKEEFNKIIDSVKVKNFTLVKDTIYKEKIKLITKPVYNTIKIPIECDSLGNVKPVEYKLNNGISKFKASIKNSNLVLSVKLDSLKSVYEKEYIQRFKKDSTNLVNKILSESKLKEKEYKVKEKISIFKHVYCFIIIIVFVLIIVYLVKK